MLLGGLSRLPDMPLTFSHLWQQSEHSDIDLVLTAAGQQDASDQAHRNLKLSSFPAHSAILSNSGHIQAQLLRWQNSHDTADEPAVKRRCTRSSKGLSSSSSSSSSKSAKGSKCASNQAARKLRSSNSAEPSSRPQVVLTLQEAAHEPAALAVLASLYATKPLPELLSELSQEQQLQAAVLADMWQMPDVSTAAVDALTAARQGAGLSDTILRQFLQLQAVPTFLLPLLGPVVTACLQHKDAGIKTSAEHVLLSVLGDLEEVLADEALKSAFLNLSLPAAELLLSSNELKVASEDTVLAATRSYVGSLHSGYCENPRYQAKTKLAPLIRCQHLSFNWLSACVLSEDGHLAFLFGSYNEQLKQLLLLRLAGSDPQPTQEEIDENMEGAPPSWLLGQRARKEVSSVQLVWPVDVSAVRKVVNGCAEAKDYETLRCPDISAPLGGIAWSLELQAEWLPHDQAVTLYLFCVPQNAAEGAWCRFKAQFEVQGYPHFTHTTCCNRAVREDQGHGVQNFFQTGNMVKGWDEDAWQDADLPTSGELRVVLTVMATSSTPGGVSFEDEPTASDVVSSDDSKSDAAAGPDAAAEGG